MHDYVLPIQANWVHLFILASLQQLLRLHNVSIIIIIIIIIITILLLPPGPVLAGETKPGAPIVVLKGARTHLELMPPTQMTKKGQKRPKGPKMAN